MILALFEVSYIKNSDTLLAIRRARTRLALASSFVLASSTDREGSVTCIAPTGVIVSTTNETSTDAFDSSGMTKEQCMALVHAMDEDAGNGQEHRKHPEMSEFVFTHLDQDNSGRVEFIEFEKLLLLCHCCDKLSRDRLLAHTATVARADLMKADAQAMLTYNYEWSRKQQHLLEETVVCQEKTIGDAHVDTEAYLNHLNQSFRICGRWESQQLDNIAVIVGIVYFWAMALGATAWVGVGFNLVYCFEVIIRIHSMKSLSQFCNDPRGRKYALQNKVTLYCTMVGMFGTIMVIHQKCSVITDQEQLWQAIQLAPLLRIFVTNSQFCQIVRALLSGLERIRPFIALFITVFYTFCMLAHYAFKDLDMRHGDVFSKELNFSTFGTVALRCSRPPLTF